MISDASFATSVPAIPYRTYMLSGYIKWDRLYYQKIQNVKCDIRIILGKITIANPTSAFFSAGPSLVPSPVTATTSRPALILLAMIPLTRVYLSIGCERARTRNFGHI